MDSSGTSSNDSSSGDNDDDTHGFRGECIQSIQQQTHSASPSASSAGSLLPPSGYLSSRTSRPPLFESLSQQLPIPSSGSIELVPRPDSPLLSVHVPPGGGGLHDSPFACYRRRSIHHPYSHDRSPFMPSSISTFSNNRLHATRPTSVPTIGGATTHRTSLSLCMNLDDSEATPSDASSGTQSYPRGAGLGESVSGGSDIDSPMSIGSAEDTHTVRRLQPRRQTSCALFHQTPPNPTGGIAVRRMSLDFDSDHRHLISPSTPVRKGIHRVLDDLKKEARPFESEIEHERATNIEVGKIFSDPLSPIHSVGTTSLNIPGSPVLLEVESPAFAPRTPIPAAQLKDPLVYYSHTSKLNPESNFLSRREASASPSSPMLISTRNKRKLSTTDFVVDRIDVTRSGKRSYRRLPSSPRTLPSPRPLSSPSSSSMGPLGPSQALMSRPRSGSGSSVSSMSSMVSDRPQGTSAAAFMMMNLDRSGSAISTTSSGYGGVGGSGSHHGGSGSSQHPPHSGAGSGGDSGSVVSSPDAYHRHMGNALPNSLHPGVIPVNSHGSTYPGSQLLNLSGPGTDFSRMSLADENGDK
ncbi:hypothetical protein BASA50_006639 [Batrachochytrium salamandrivorans]|uniref:Uncharacterized protein n=1 Tax=Batrachochytrium salamandrivorans TaxID=1357716 RepID=A0ABQ8F982_9FUNG|nr:hypothetical protein BASA62_000255 [Batrachochytrium salamandrivorans]KAH6578346.1 hypothetical protein BASA61_000338 [Batrachochytrium salamandrivorans]KAH6594392.1 hypothetical protein BASA50_006639 [Batrachochytrium salamandrivorans]KAH9252178.1 hypothetical protein BASA81_009929 [Batrachochytrium salamandrivorans]KAH9274853.1 hypothetical protein BASA83_002563 [Batrachochytrium salamandrivorans]